MSAPDFIAALSAQADEILCLHQLLTRCPTAADRKGLIIAAHCHGAVSQEMCALLIQAYGLETA